MDFSVLAAPVGSGSVGMSKEATPTTVLQLVRSANRSPSRITRARDFLNAPLVGSGPTPAEAAGLSWQLARTPIPGTPAISAVPGAVLDWTSDRLRGLIGRFRTPPPPPRTAFERFQDWARGLPDALRGQFDAAVAAKGVKTGAYLAPAVTWYPSASSVLLPQVVGMEKSAFAPLNKVKQLGQQAWTGAIGAGRRVRAGAHQLGQAAATKLRAGSDFVDRHGQRAVDWVGNKGVALGRGAWAGLSSAPSYLAPKVRAGSDFVDRHGQRVVDWVGGLPKNIHRSALDPNYRSWGGAVHASFDNAITNLRTLGGRRMAVGGGDAAYYAARNQASAAGATATDARRLGQDARRAVRNKGALEGDMPTSLVRGANPGNLQITVPRSLSVPAARQVRGDVVAALNNAPEVRAALDRLNRSLPPNRQVRNVADLGDVDLASLNPAQKNALTRANKAVTTQLESPAMVNTIRASSAQRALEAPVRGRDAPLVSPAGLQAATQGAEAQVADALTTAGNITTADEATRLMRSLGTAGSPAEAANRASRLSNAIRNNSTAEGVMNAFKQELERMSPSARAVARKSLEDNGFPVPISASEVGEVSAAVNLAYRKKTKPGVDPLEDLNPFQREALDAAGDYAPVRQALDAERAAQAALKEHSAAAPKNPGKRAGPAARKQYANDRSAWEAERTRLSAQLGSASKARATAEEAYRTDAITNLTDPTFQAEHAARVNAASQKRMSDKVLAEGTARVDTITAEGMAYAQRARAANREKILSIHERVKRNPQVKLSDSDKRILAQSGYEVDPSGSGLREVVAPTLPGSAGPASQMAPPVSAGSPMAPPAAAAQPVAPTTPTAPVADNPLTAPAAAQGTPGATWMDRINSLTPGQAAAIFGAGGFGLGAALGD